MSFIAASDFLNTVRKINTELGTTVIITEHRLEDIFPYADRAVVMEKGRVIADDTKGIDSFFKETFAGILADLKKQGIISPVHW